MMDLTKTVACNKKRAELNQQAREAACELCSFLDTDDLNDGELETLGTIAEKFFWQWFNDREAALMKREYLVAEAVDMIVLRHDEARLHLFKAVAELCDCFYKACVEPEEEPERREEHYKYLFHTMPAVKV